MEWEESLLIFNDPSSKLKLQHNDLKKLIINYLLLDLKSLIYITKKCNNINKQSNNNNNNENNALYNLICDNRKVYEMLWNKYMPLGTPVGQKSCRKNTIG